MTKRYVSLPDEAEAGMREFISEVDQRLAGEEDTCSVVEDVLIDLSGDREAYERWQAGESVSTAERIRLQSYDPCNTTLESEYYAEKDEAQFRRSKHLQWLWRQFDSLPIADNVEFALRFRRMLADHLFEECGDGCRFFKGISFTYGHNITIGDNTVVHDDVHLDDRGKLTIGDRVSISDGVHIYSHDHDVVDQTEVRNYHTTVEDDVRLTYDSMVRAGCTVGENAIVGARGIVQHDIPAHHIAIGAPAKSAKIKPGWEDVATPIEEAGINRQEERRLEYDLPEELTVFDEFGRDLSTPE
ncbi:acyltransferase [Natronorubrum daqingense]|uniref:Acetyltransferase n=1 Tax=Natronorubrum daqingense TaxID=588898 RepID=A0A1N7CSB9_9EURY|nr:acyltransferase [Natronorubrum daqingense]APX97038.1 acetyltransferase [Natronorubrum daqingense]SIR66473.1 Acetyltransferase (isoleucine patch superfamily) [Natronorubrum daqingense]